MLNMLELNIAFPKLNIQHRSNILAQTPFFTIKTASFIYGNLYIYIDIETCLLHIINSKHVENVLKQQAC